MGSVIIIAGHMRTWKTCAHTFKWHVARHLPKPLHFYISTVQDEDADDWKITQELFRPKTLISKVEPSQPELPEPVEPVRFEPYARSVPMQAVLRQLWQLEQGWKLYSDHPVGDVDLFVRVRPDLFFHSFDQTYTPIINEALTPWWGRFGGINDRFAIMGGLAAAEYFQTFSKLEQLREAGCPVHPESLVKGSLRQAYCIVRDNLRVEFSTLRKTGEMRPPEISAIDIAHAGLR
jgi:hypothetical protein